MHKCKVKEILGFTTYTASGGMPLMKNLEIFKQINSKNFYIRGKI